MPITPTTSRIGWPRFALVEGDCYDDRSGLAASTEIVDDIRLQEVACDQPHDAEVYALVEHPLPADADFPGDDAMVQFAAAECLPRFEPFVGTAYGQSRLDVSFVFPQADAWRILDDRTLVCSVVPIDGAPLVGSMRGPAA